jgi:hypothetical protein
MRWSEIRRYTRGAATVRLLRRETMILVPKSVAQMFIPRRRWRVEVQEPTKAHVLLETSAEADAWQAYRRESGDER